VPLVVAEEWAGALAGLSLKNVEVTMCEGAQTSHSERRALAPEVEESYIKSGDPSTSLRMTFAPKKPIFADFGEMLFTHYGVSGPLILSASAHIRDYSRPHKLTINLKPALTSDTLDKRIQRDFTKYANKAYKNALCDLLPKSLIEVIIQLSGINPDKKVNEITREERITLVKLLQNLPLTITGPRPIAEAIVTSGGVATDEINPATMESKLCRGLYFAGEVIDVDAYTGGFNLQIAFSTGHVAGSRA